MVVVRKVYLLTNSLTRYWFTVKTTFRDILLCCDGRVEFFGVYEDFGPIDQRYQVKIGLVSSLTFTHFKVAVSLADYQESVIIRG